jgi:hypothetical protein
MSDCRVKAYPRKRRISMPRPGWDVVSRDAPVAPQVPTDTSVWFVVGGTEKGPATTATLVRSLDSYEAIYGSRAGGAPLYDAIDVFFREGGTKCYVSALPTTPSTALAEASANGNGEERPARGRGRASAEETAGGDVVAPQVLPTDLVTLLDVFTAGLGPGQVSAPGSTDPTVNTALMNHAATNNRCALIESPPGANTAALLTYVGTLHTQTGARNSALFAPLAVVPGVTSGTTRSVGWTAVEAGIIARNDGRGFNPNIAAAGVNGASSYATDLEARFIDSDYTQLAAAGVNMAQDRWGALETYGYRTAVDSTQVPLWWSFGHSRLNMAITADAGAIAERYVFSEIDGKGKRIAQFGGDLRAMLVPFHESGALYGDTFEDAAQVNVGPAVNTPDTIANGELHAVLMLRMSPFAEYVVIEVVKVATTQAIAAAA